MRTPFIAALLSAFIAWTPFSSATAQQVTERQASFESLADSQWVRVVTPGLTRQQGRLLSHASDTLRLDRGADSLLHIWAMDVDSLWVRGNSWKTGAVVGSVLGAAFGVVFGLGASEFACDCGDASAGAGVAGGAAGLVAGGLLGSLVGTLFPKWHSRWP